MKISNKFNYSDQLYFKNNFKIKESNVSYIEDAEIILIGEKHSLLDNQLKECWLISKLSRERDTVFLEGFEGKGIPLKYLKNSNISFVGWDSIARIGIYTAFFIRISSHFKKLKQWLFIDITQSEKIKEFFNILLERGISNDLIEKLFEEASQLGIVLKNNPNLTFLTFTKKLFLAAQQASNELNDQRLLLLYYWILKELFWEIANVELLHMIIDLVYRNRSLIHHIENSKNSSNKSFVIAGKGHFCYLPRRDSIIYSQPVEELRMILKNKKYVIVCLRNNTKDQNYAESYFKKSNFSILLKIIIIIHRFVSSIYRMIGRDYSIGRKQYVGCKEISSLRMQLKDTIRLLERKISNFPKSIINEVEKQLNKHANQNQNHSVKFFVSGKLILKPIAAGTE